MEVLEFNLRAMEVMNKFSESYDVSKLSESLDLSMDMSKESMYTMMVCFVQDI